jgi:hypothetical protein
MPARKNNPRARTLRLIVDSFAVRTISPNAESTLTTWTDRVLTDDESASGT